MPQAATVTYTRNTVRVTFRTYTWEDVQASATSLKASLFKIEGKELVPLPVMQNKVVDGTTFKESTAGEYRLFVETDQLSPGEYRIAFEGTIDGSSFYEPVAITLTTLKEKVRG